MFSFTQFFCQFGDCKRLPYLACTQETGQEYSSKHCGLDEEVESWVVQRNMGVTTRPVPGREQSEWHWREIKKGGEERDAEANQ